MLIDFKDTKLKKENKKGATDVKRPKYSQNHSKEINEFTLYSAIQRSKNP